MYDRVFFNMSERVDSLLITVLVDYLICTAVFDLKIPGLLRTLCYVRPGEMWVNLNITL